MSGCQSRRAARRFSPCCRASEWRGRNPRYPHSNPYPSCPTNSWPDLFFSPEAHLNVHSRCQGCSDSLTQREVSPLDSPVNDVIVVHCHSQTDWQAHLLSNAPSLVQDRKTKGFLDKGKDFLKCEFNKKKKRQIFCCVKMRDGRKGRGGEKRKRRGREVG